VPSPFKANQLDAVAYELNAIEASLNAVLASPPDDGIPADALAGVQSRAQAIVDLADSYLNGVPSPIDE
jgi:hypothetical protein